MEFKKKFLKKINVSRVQAVNGGFIPQRFTILHFILHLSSMQLLNSQRVNITGWALEVIEFLANVCSYLHHFRNTWCPRVLSPLLLSVLCSFCRRSSVSSSVLDPPSSSLLMHSFLFVLPDLSQCLEACERFLTKTLIKKANMIVLGYKIMMNAIYISICPPYLSPIKIILLICTRSKVFLLLLWKCCEAAGIVACVVTIVPIHRVRCF